MLNAWVVFPSATLEKANAAVDAWSKQGYRTLIYQDIGAQVCNADVVRFGEFPGYYKIVNSLVEAAMCEGADIITCAADDMLPDPHSTAQDIGRAYFATFPDGEGVLQACGDMQGMDERGTPAAARICGSPTFGRDWIMRSYEGRGPFWDGYGSFYGDEDLYNVAQMHKRLWMAREYTFQHRHWSFNWSDQTWYQKRNSNLHWETDATLFAERKGKGFPKSGLLAT